MVYADDFYLSQGFSITSAIGGIIVGIGASSCGRLQGPENLHREGGRCKEVLCQVGRVVLVDCL